LYTKPTRTYKPKILRTELQIIPEGQDVLLKKKCIEEIQDGD
jgi:hypothetical protein